MMSPLVLHLPDSRQCLALFVVAEGWMLQYSIFARLMRFSFTALYDMPGLAPLINGVILVARDFQVSFSSRDVSWNA